MKLSLQTRVSIVITLTIILISAVSTYLFTSAHRGSAERGLLVRGEALTYALSKAAEEGLLKEDLNLIKKASHITTAPDVTLVQVYSNIWEAVDSYPMTRLKEPPDGEALHHFKTSIAPFSVRGKGGYDFYEPILFRPFEDSPPSVIGYVRLTLSSSAIDLELKRIVVVSVLVAGVITLVAIVVLNLLMRLFIVRPVTALHRSVAQFKHGILPSDLGVSPHAADEIRDLVREFQQMCETVKEKEARLVASEQRIRSLFERVEHALFRINAEGEITEANGRFLALFGGVTGLCDILIGEASAPNCLRRAATERTLHIEDKAIARNGEELNVSLSLYAERNNGGAVTGFDGYIIDISEKKRLEERLIRSQKLEAVGTLAAGMAHDFNNLLTAILGYSGIMLKTFKEDDPLYKPASIIHDAAKRGAELGRKILSVTRKEKMEAKQVSVNDIIAQSLDLLQRSLPKNIEITTKLHPALPPTNADPAQLQQVIINLAVNARDAMPRGGKLTIETSVAAPAVGNTAPAEAPGFVKLSVSDTGMGIDYEMQARIFDPFFTTKEVGKGTGLGLYIVHSIISNHGGYINLYSEPNQGTRFNIYLPIAKGAGVGPQAESMDINGTETVLVIDDEPDLRGLCRDMLTPLGYTVLLAESGSAGINLYRDRRNEISLVILDMVMPKMAGNEVFAALKTINPGVRVLLYSGYSNNNFAGINQLLHTGAVGFIQKPFSVQEIGMAIRNALSR